jgi:hypothetical protein
LLVAQLHARLAAMESMLLTTAASTRKPRPGSDDDDFYTPDRSQGAMNATPSLIRRISHVSMVGWCMWTLSNPS